jgi:hypothetical protein
MTRSRYHVSDERRDLRHSPSLALPAGGDMNRILGVSDRNKEFDNSMESVKDFLSSLGN